MEEVLSQLKAIQTICNRQKVELGPYVLSQYCHRVQLDNGELLYHNMTGELLHLAPLEVGDMLADGGLSDELIARRFLVPEGFNEYGYAQEVKQVIQLIGRRSSFVTHFVVFPTTDCNARCFYCYELGRPRKAMDDMVARDVASFIARRSGGKDIRINWFGGEPTYNSRAIDIITNDLSSRGIGFSSQMTTNGYLFDEDLVAHAQQDWKLDSVQITLDGTEELYNCSKAFVGINCSAYQRVMRNIALLADAGVRVSIRLNLNAHNERDLYRLADELAERFGERSNIVVYTVLLRDFGHDAHLHETEEQALQAYESLQRHLVDLGVGRRWYPRTAALANQCMADNDNWLTILPDGRLGKCEHESEEKLVGSIYQDGLDTAALRDWKRVTDIPACRSCLFYPSCMRLVQCAWHKEGCTEFDRMIMYSNLTRRVLNAYESFLTGQVVENNDEQTFDSSQW